MPISWQPSDIGADPADYAEGEVPVRDASGLFVPGEGGSSAAYAVVVGDGGTTSFDVAHGLGTSAVAVTGSSFASGFEVPLGVIIVDANTVRVVVGAAPSDEDLRVLVVGAKVGTGVNATASGGGAIATVGGYNVHTFTADGTFEVSGGSLDVEYLIVAGGGGGGARTSYSTYRGGGGGAGGFIKAARTLPVGTYPVTVGSGGAGASGGLGTQGADSIAFDLTAIGGGGGGGSVGDDGGDGGSGGGAPGNSNTGGSGLQPASVSGGLGNRGGNAASGENGTPVAGGGGGASARGQDSAEGGNGGDGSEFPVTGPIYGGGGGGGQMASTAGLGGTGGGGDGATNTLPAVAGQSATGGGGGGGHAGAPGATGGSGIVIVRYPI